MSPIQALPTFSILDHIEKLTPVKGKNRYICPVCEGNNLTTDPKDGAYKCWNGCECKDIREAIAPLPKSEPKPIRPKDDRTFVYTDRQGEPLIRVRRTDDGKGNRQIWQEYWDGKCWQRNVSDSIKTAAKKAIAPYRYLECIEAAKLEQPIFCAEGESCVDALWSIGIPATTTIGGSSGYSSYGDYSKDFQGFDLVICPDRDLAGIKYAEAIAQDYPNARWLYAYPDSPWWNRLPKEGRADLLTKENTY